MGNRGWRGVQFLRWTSTNNNRWTSWLFIVLWSDISQQWWPGVYTGHSHTASWQGEGQERHLKEPCKGLRSKGRHIMHCATLPRLKTITRFWHCAITGSRLHAGKLPVLEALTSFPYTHSFSESASRIHLWGRSDGDECSHNSRGLYANVVLPVCVGKLHCALLMWHPRCCLADVLIGSRTPSKDLHFYYNMRGKPKQYNSTCTGQTHNLRGLIEYIQMWFIEQLHSHSAST